MLGVLITYHNECELLTDCLESLRSQVSPVDEILIYDDASEHPPDRYVPSGLPVRLFAGKVNLGPARGRNILLRQASSQYIHFHDSDDLFHPQWSRRIRQELADADVDAVFTEVSFCSEHGEPGDCVLGLQELARGEDPVRFSLRGAVLVPAGTYRTTAVLRVGGYRESLWQSEDFDFHVRLMASGITYRVVQDALVLCRSRSASRSKDRVEVFKSALQAVRMLSHELPPSYIPELAERAASFGAQLFRIGARGEARAAFQLANILGPPRFSNERRLYRVVGRLLGPECVERFGAWYRRMVPKTLRSMLAQRWL